METETTTSYTHQEEEDEHNDNNTNEENVLNQIRASTDEHAIVAEKISTSMTKNLKEEDPDASDDLSDDDQSEDDDDDEEEEVEVEVEPENLQQQQREEQKSPKPTIASDDEDEDEDEDDDTNPNPRKKQKSLSSFNIIESPETAPPVQIPTTTTTAAAEPTAATAGETVTVAEVSVATAAAVAVSTTAVVKKPKKKNNNVWTKSTRKGKKKTKSNNHNGTATEDTVLITPIPRFPDRSDDSADAKICLSKVYKAEKVELSEDRLSAGSSKGYRMVRATRGVVEGAWYFEIRVLKLGETGHTRLGWSMEKGDLQAPVGYDGNSFGYRDVDGSRVHKAVREKYGEEGYAEGDVIGCYINLPDGGGYAPKLPHFVWYKGQRYLRAADGKEESPKVVPGSEISFFKNGVCQGAAFKDLFGGHYYPAASMYTLPNQPNCVVTFNFGPDFEFFPQDFDGRPMPRPMIEVPYHGFDSRVENGESNEKKH